VLKKQLPFGFLSLPQLPEYVQPQTADSVRVRDVGMGAARAGQVVESGEAVTVTVEMDVEGMETVDTVVMKVGTGSVVVTVVVVVDV
jgi:hypothetical protein